MREKKTTTWFLRRVKVQAPHLQDLTKKSSYYKTNLQNMHETNQLPSTDVKKIYSVDKVKIKVNIISSQCQAKSPENREANRFRRARKENQYRDLWAKIMFLNECLQRRKPSGRNHTGNKKSLFQLNCTDYKQRKKNKISAVLEFYFDNKIPKSCLRHKVGILGIPPAAMKVDSAALYLHLECACSLTSHYSTINPAAHETSNYQSSLDTGERGSQVGGKEDEQREREGNLH